MDLGRKKETQMANELNISDKYEMAIDRAGMREELDAALAAYRFAKGTFEFQIAAATDKLSIKEAKSAIRNIDEMWYPLLKAHTLAIEDIYQRAMIRARLCNK
jgi:hypothetical protein